MLYLTSCPQESAGHAGDIALSSQQGAEQAIWPADVEGWQKEEEKCCTWGSRASPSHLLQTRPPAGALQLLAFTPQPAPSPLSSPCPTQIGSYTTI